MADVHPVEGVESWYLLEFLEQITSISLGTNKLLTSGWVDWAVRFFAVGFLLGCLLVDF